MLEPVTVEGAITAIRINGEEFPREEGSGHVIVPKRLLKNFTLSEIPKDIFIKPVESIDDNVIKQNDDVAFGGPNDDGSHSAFIEFVQRRKFWDADVGLSRYMAAFRQAIVQNGDAMEDEFEDDGDYVSVRYEIVTEDDLDIQGAIAFVESNIRSIEQRTDQLLNRRSDPVLEIFDRGSLDADLDYVLRTAKGSTALVMADIDHFKNVNDTHGHQVGDTVLRAVAQTLAAHCGSGSAAYRYGGEELVAILSGTERDSAVQFAESVRTAVKKLQFEGHPRLRVTISLGVAVAPIDGKTRTELVRAADAALYEAKHSGRDRVKSTQAVNIESAAVSKVFRVVVVADDKELYRSLELFVVCAQWVKDPDRRRVEEMRTGTNDVIREVPHKECCAALRELLPTNKHLTPSERSDLEECIRKAC